MKRGEELPQSKLTNKIVREILATVEKRNELKAELATMSNKAMAKKYGCHYRTVDKVTGFHTWTHVDG